MVRQARARNMCQRSVRDEWVDAKVMWHCNN